MSTLNNDNSLLETGLSTTVSGVALGINALLLQTTSATTSEESVVTPGSLGFYEGAANATAFPVYTLVNSTAEDSLCGNSGEIVGGTSLVASSAVILKIVDGSETYDEKGILDAILGILRNDGSHNDVQYNKVDIQAERIYNAITKEEETGTIITKEEEVAELLEDIYTMFESKEDLIVALETYRNVLTELEEKDNVKKRILKVESNSHN